MIFLHFYFFSLTRTTVDNKKNIVQKRTLRILTYRRRFRGIGKNTVSRRETQSQTELATHRLKPTFFDYVRPRQPARSHYYAHKSQCRTFRCETICRLSFLPDVHPCPARFRSSLHLRRHGKSATLIPLVYLSLKEHRRLLSGCMPRDGSRQASVYLHSQKRKIILERREVYIYSQFSHQYLLSIILNLHPAASVISWTTLFVYTITTGIVQRTKVEAKEKTTYKIEAHNHTMLWFSRDLTSDTNTLKLEFPIHWKQKNRNVACRNRKHLSFYVCTAWRLLSIFVYLHHNVFRVFRSLILSTCNTYIEYILDLYYSESASITGPNMDSLKCKDKRISVFFEEIKEGNCERTCIFPCSSLQLPSCRRVKDAAHKYL